MDDLDLYVIDNDYIQYLQTKEKQARGFTKVSNNMTDEYNHQKPYVGIVLRINNCKYFAPLTHPKSHYDDKSKFFNRISEPIKLTNGRDYGRIMFCYMVPIMNDSVIQRININQIKDAKYKSVLMTQYFYINSQHGNKKVSNKACALYQKVHNNPSHFLYPYCCAFELLEECCREYKK